MSFIELIRERSKKEAQDLFSEETDVFAVEGQTVISNQVAPTRGYFGILNIRGDARYYHEGVIVYVECIGGEFCKGVVHRKYGNILEMREPLNRDPKMGGKVRKIMGENENVFRQVRDDEKIKIFVSGYKK